MVRDHHQIVQNLVQRGVDRSLLIGLAQHMFGDVQDLHTCLSYLVGGIGLCSEAPQTLSHEQLVQYVLQVEGVRVRL